MNDHMDNVPTPLVYKDPTMVDPRHVTHLVLATALLLDGQCTSYIEDGSGTIRQAWEERQRMLKANLRAALAPFEATPPYTRGG